MYASELDAFQGSWFLESSVNDGVVHNIIQGLYATTYASSRFALPKDRVLETLGVGVANAPRQFTKRDWETAVSYSLEILQNKDASCSFLVSWLFFYFHLIFPHSLLFRSCPVCCTNATKRLIESVVRVKPRDIVSLEIAREIMSLFDRNPIMSDLPLLSVTCSSQDLALDIMALLSCFRGLPVEIYPHEGLPKHLPVLSAIRPLAGRRFGPDFLSQLIQSASYDGFAGWKPLCQFSLILSSLRSHRFELTSHR